MIHLDTPTTSLSTPALAALENNPLQTDLQGHKVKIQAVHEGMMAITILALIILPVAVVGGFITGLTLFATGVKPLIALSIGALIPLVGVITVTLPILGMASMARRAQN